MSAGLDEMDESCIIHAPKSFFVAIREDYVGICKAAGLSHPLCAAALLNLFERWANGKYAAFDAELVKHRTAKENKEAYRVKVDMWIYMPQRQIQDELQGLFGEKMIAQSLKDLLNIKWLKSRNNPDSARDRTLQYLFFPARILKALHAWANSEVAPERVRAASKAQKYGIQSAKMRNGSRKNAEALPQSLSESDTQRGKKKNVPPQPKPKDPFLSSMDGKVDVYIAAWRSGHRIPPIDTMTGYKRQDAITHVAQLEAMGCTPTDLSDFVKERETAGKSTKWAFVMEDIHTYMARKAAPTPIEVSNPDDVFADRPSIYGFYFQPKQDLAS